MTKRKRNRSSGATAFLALVAAGVITVGEAARQQLTATPIMAVSIAVLLIYIYKLKK